METFFDVVVQMFDIQFDRTIVIAYINLYILEFDIWVF